MSDLLTIHTPITISKLVAITNAIDDQFPGAMAKPAPNGDLIITHPTVDDAPRIRLADAWAVLDEHVERLRRDLADGRPGNPIDQFLVDAWDRITGGPVA